MVDVHHPLPHFERLLERMKSRDAPMIVLWAWPGSGLRRFVAWLSRRLADEALVLRPADATGPRLKELLSQHEKARYVLVTSVDDDQWLPLTRQLLPQQSLVIATHRSAIPEGVRSSVIGPTEFLLLRSEAQQVVPELPETELDPIVARTSGWFAPLEMLSRAELSEDPAAGERAELELETFLESEVLSPLEVVERAVVMRLLAGRPVPEEILAEGPIDENPLLWSLRHGHCFIDAASRSVLPPLLYGRDFGRVRVFEEDGPTTWDGSERRRTEGGLLDDTAFDGYSVTLLGIPQVARCTRKQMIDISWKLRRALHLLAFLCSRPGLAAGREEVVDALWPDDGEDTVERNLHPTVSILRRSLRVRGKDNAVLLRNGVYRLSPEFDWRIDAVDFERAVLTGRPIEGVEPAVGPDVGAWEEAWKLYRGPFLQGHESPWIFRRREELQRLYLDVLRGLGDAYLAEGRRSDAEDAFRSVLNVDPVQESVHLSIMTIYADRGRRDLVRKQYERLCGLLQEELGVEPMPSTAAEYHRLMS